MRVIDIQLLDIPNSGRDTNTLFIMKKLSVMGIPTTFSFLTPQDKHQDILTIVYGFILAQLA
jgi:hypothetical protein